MTWVKVCGIRDDASAGVAAAGGADAIGFVIDPGSPRYVDPDAVSGIGVGLEVMRFLVAVDVEPVALLAMAKAAKAHGIQPHGRHAAAAAAAATDAGYRVLRPVKVDGPVGVDDVPADQTPIFDTAVPGRHGGTGETFDWRHVTGVERDFVMAGGLGPENVVAAIRSVRPWGVDASSGLESAPGVKDHAKIEAFVKEAKQA